MLVVRVDVPMSLCIWLPLPHCGFRWGQRKYSGSLSRYLQLLTVWLQYCNENIIMIYLQIKSIISSCLDPLLLNQVNGSECGRLLNRADRVVNTGPTTCLASSRWRWLVGRPPSVRCSAGQLSQSVVKIKPTWWKPVGAVGSLCEHQERVWPGQTVSSASLISVRQS